MSKVVQHLKHVFAYTFLAVAFLLPPLHGYSQSTTISGTVEDGTGEKLPGVSIIEKGTTNGAITDSEGRYRLDVPSDAVLIFSFIGMNSQEVPIAGRSTLDIVMEENISELEEVVIVGYGTQKKKDLTGAIAGVEAKTISERGATSPIQSLQGSVSGVQITNSTGRVGDGFNVTIRGKNSIKDGSNSPLYVVDGVITESIDFLNPQDIAKIDILKDASSAAIYGSRGSNGVVIVQTKSGANIPSGTSFSFESYVGVKSTARLPKMMSPEKWKYYHTSAYLATSNNGAGRTPEEYMDQVVLPPSNNSVLRERFDNLDGFDWYDAVLKTGTQTNNHLSIAHRAGASAYTLGLGYQKETGNIENEELEKFTLRSGIDQEINSKLKVGANISLSLTNLQRGSELAMQEAFRLNPFLSPWAIDENNNEIVGELFPQPGKLTDPNGNVVIDKTSTYNPLLEIQNSSNETRQWNGVGNTYIKYDVVDWLTFQSTFSMGLQTSRRGVYFGGMTNEGVSFGGEASSRVNRFENFNYTWDNQLNFNKTYGDHSFNALALQSIFVNRTETEYFSSRYQPAEREFYNVGLGAPSSYTLGNVFFKSQLASFALRLNYTYKDRYLLTLTNRWDGSSLFPEENRWDSFPSAALGWRITEEDFMDVDAISDLKFRVSYGATGNNNVDPYSSLNVLSSRSFYNFGNPNDVAQGFAADTLANKNLKWEKTSEVNVGLDFSLLDYRVTGSVDWYSRTSDELLVDQKLPFETGYSAINSNAASVRNSGVEVLLTTTNIRNEALTWETTFTFTKNTNEILSIYGQKENDDVANGWFIGESIDAHYNYEFAGIWQADEADQAKAYNQTVGQAKVTDVNNDTEIKPEDDRIILGSANPDWTGGLISRLNLFNFDFTFSLSAVQGVLAYSNFHSNFEDVRDRGRQKLDIADWYIPENNVGVPAQTSNSYPQPRNEGAYWRNNGVGYYKDASYVKVNNISLGYTIPQNLLNRWNVEQLRVYVNVLNPFVFTDYTGYDPEWAGASLGVGRVSSVTTQFGLSLKF
ncbi:SusC/RagA family TonB-linked outer membrane protein [Fulvivirga sediminis]|uniref:TonB-dependent receptor n=1 Tax=Fulvivirga sediminis TaxID=2803949 RepID=A0A937F8V4_9BACT|nr:TonB-dependent receptor [Fulvivirga sediminis]MBL3656118.1 TonB-dependent receptor [Fulvivirga sediminis]